MPEIESPRVDNRFCLLHFQSLCLCKESTALASENSGGIGKSSTVSDAPANEIPKKLLSEACLSLNAWLSVSFSSISYINDIAPRILDL